MMKKYIGTKVLKATPMNRGDYNILRGWNIPENEEPKEDGYLVEYQDGGKPNHPDYQGYISWSPKDVFEKAYQVADTFLDRLRIEQQDLAEKLQKLCLFVDTPKFEEVVKDEHQRDLLLQQRDYMGEYLNILTKRIKTL